MAPAVQPLMTSFVYAWNLESLLLSRRASKEAWHHSSSFLAAGGYRWRLTLHPTCHEEEGGKSYWSLFLMPEDATVLPPHFIVETILEISLFNEKNKQNKRAVVCEIWKGKSEEEKSTSIISLETLGCPSSGFLTVEVSDITVEAKEDHAPSSQPEEKMEFTWKIDGFSKLTSFLYKSAPFLIGGKIWHIVLYPKGSHQSGHLSLFLELDNANELPSSDKVCADFIFVVVDQIHGNNHEHRADCNFSSKHASWGYQLFIPLGELLDPSKGFLVNDTCVVKVVFRSCKQQ